MISLFVPRVATLGLGSLLLLHVSSSYLFAEQTPGSISEFFEGRTVGVKLDMPGTQQGVDIYPQRPQTLDMKSYSNRLKQFGVSLRNGDSAMVTKVKVKDNNIEFQLAGGGYGTSGEDTDTSVHFTPMEKSGREKDVENQLKGEKDNERRRSLQRELDDLRSYRERRDRHEREMAEQAAESKRQMILSRRMQGGSRFNLHIESRNATEPVTPQVIMAALAQYVDFPAQAFNGSPNGHVPQPQPMTSAAPPAPIAPMADPSAGLKKGLTRDQVDAMYGQPAEVHESEQNGLKMMNCVYASGDNSLKASFVNGVLVQYSISSR